MTVAGVASREPSVVRSIQTLDSAPVKKRSRIEENDYSDADSGDHRKIKIGPVLPGRFRVGKTVKRAGDHQDGNCQRRAGKMDDVRFLRQDHAGYTHAGAPKIIRSPKLPEAEQSENEHHREEHEPYFVDRVAAVKNKPG